VNTKATQNTDLRAAQRAKKDEFYTSLEDIEREMRHYRKHFRDKTVLCNCDDPRLSNFFRFFAYHFQFLGLKKLITTCYQSRSDTLFSQNDSATAVYLEYEGDKNGNRVPDPAEIGIKSLKGDGDFRSAECIALLKEADIVVTNPPFSLFREFIAQLMQHEKQFLIIGNVNAITYKEVFPLIRDNKVWIGPSIRSGDRKFGVPDDYPLNAAGCGVDENGKKFIRVKGVRWYTNLDFKDRHEDLVLHRKYNAKDFPSYDNYDAIEVGKTNDIPTDYFGAMGVPITFLDRFNPSQFEILGITDRDDNSGLKTKVYSRLDSEKYGDLNRRGAIKNAKSYKPTYARVFIRRKVA
jgi:Adenine-specific methyltransferase EcoRI